MQPTDAQREMWRARFSDSSTTWTQWVDAIFADGVEAAQAGMTVEWGVRRPQDEQVLICDDERQARRIAAGVLAGLLTRVVTSRRTDWQATP